MIDNEPMDNVFPRLHVLGDGPHSREVAALAAEIGYAEVRCVGEEDEDGIPATSFVTLGMGNAYLRYSALSRIVSQFNLVSLLHPRSLISASSTIGAGSFVASGVVISNNTAVSRGVLLNWNTSIGHDVSIGEGTAIAPQVAISGGVSIGKGVRIGAGAVVLEGIQIGNFCTIGAGAVVNRDVASDLTVVGVPARPIAKSSGRFDGGGKPTN